MTPGAPRLWAVPIGTEADRCRGCDAPIYFVRTAKGHRMPVDCREHVTPTRATPGEGVSHFGTCPKAGAFKRLKRFKRHEERGRAG